MKIFMAAPFTDKIDPATTLIENSYRMWLEGLISQLRNKGHIIINSHEREEWGNKLYPPEEAIVDDFNGIIASDLLLAFLDEPPSPGVQMELGFAAAKKKPIIIFSLNSTRSPYLIKGLSKWTKAWLLKYTEADSINIAEDLDEIISKNKIKAKIQKP